MCHAVLCCAFCVGCEYLGELSSKYGALEYLGVECLVCNEPPSDAYQICLLCSVHQGDFDYARSNKRLHAKYEKKNMQTITIFDDAK